MMWVGQLLFLAPLSVALDIVPFLGPFLGDLVSFGAGVISLPITLMLSLFTISVAWIAVRPALGVPLFLISIGERRAHAVSSSIVRRCAKTPPPPPCCHPPMRL